MLQNSNDVLNLVLALSILMVAVALTWAMVYAIKILKSFSDLSRAVRSTIDSIQSAIAHWQHKIESTASYLPLIMGGISKIVSYFSKKKRQHDEPADEEEMEDEDNTKKTKKKVKVNVN